MQTENIQARIESYTSSLPQAVQASHGAQFALLLSLISTNQANTLQYTPVGTPEAANSTFSVAQSLYLNENELHTPLLVERLNEAVNEHLEGDFAYLNSHIATLAERPRTAVPTADSFAKMALIANGALVLDQIQQSQVSVRA